MSDTSEILKMSLVILFVLFLVAVFPVLAVRLLNTPVETRSEECTGYVVNVESYYIKPMWHYKVDVIVDGNAIRSTNQSDYAIFKDHENEDFTGTIEYSLDKKGNTVAVSFKDVVFEGILIE